MCAIDSSIYMEYCGCSAELILECDVSNNDWIFCNMALFYLVYSGEYSGMDGNQGQKVKLEYMKN
jgi:hypothetical protein